MNQEHTPNTKHAYAILDWSTRFENAQSRKQKSVAHVLSPYHLESTEYRKLIQREGGHTAFLTWIGIVEIATRCPQRGLLVNERLVPTSGSRDRRLPAAIRRSFGPELPEAESVVDHTEDNSQHAHQKTVAENRPSAPNVVEHIGTNQQPSPTNTPAKSKTASPKPKKPSPKKEDASLDFAAFLQPPSSSKAS